MSVRWTTAAALIRASTHTAAMNVFVLTDFNSTVTALTLASVRLSSRSEISSIYRIFYLNSVLNLVNAS